MKANGKLVIKCVKCDKSYVINGNDLDFEIVEISNRKMSKETTHHTQKEIICDCGNVINFILDVYEYPEGVYNSHTHQLEGGILANEIKFNYKF